MAHTPPQQEREPLGWTPPPLSKPPCNGWTNPPDLDTLCGKPGEIIAVHPGGVVGLNSIVCRQCSRAPHWVAAYGDWEHLLVKSPQGQALLR